MPTTSWQDFTAEIREIPNRTDSAGASVDDLPLREDQLVNAILTEGVVTPAGAFKPAKGSGDFDVDIGSGTSGADIFVVASDVTGQQPYIVTLEQASATVTLDAADADPRIDEIYLVVRDDGVDSNSDGHRLPRFGYRKGDSATSDPAAPGPDSGWENYALLASISVAGGATSITASDITDERATSQFLQLVFDEAVRNTAASVFGSVLDSRYAELTGDTFTGQVTMAGVRVFVDQNGDVLLERDVNGTPHQLRVWQGTAAAVLEHLRDGSTVSEIHFKDGEVALVTGSLDLANGAISNVADPSNAQDAATKSYVDSNAPQTEAGTYTGDGSTSGDRTISTSFTPDIVWVVAVDGVSDGNFDTGMMTNTSRGTVWSKWSNANNHGSKVRLASGGFVVGGSGDPNWLNENNIQFSYTAMKTP